MGVMDWILSDRARNNALLAHTESCPTLHIYHRLMASEFL